MAVGWEFPEFPAIEARMLTWKTRGLGGVYASLGLPVNPSTLQASVSPSVNQEMTLDALSHLAVLFKGVSVEVGSHSVALGCLHGILGVCP